jgi:hypothetical protein
VTSIARPEHRGERHVADRADEAEDGDQRPDEDVLERPHERRGVGDKEEVEEVVAEQADEAGEQEAGRDLLPQHRPVGAEVLGDSGPGAGVGAVVVDVARLRLLRVAPRLRFQPRNRVIAAWVWPLTSAETRCDPPASIVSSPGWAATSAPIASISPSTQRTPPAPPSMTAPVTVSPLIPPPDVPSIVPPYGYLSPGTSSRQLR